VGRKAFGLAMMDIWVALQVDELNPKAHSQKRSVDLGISDFKLSRWIVKSCFCESIGP